MAQDEALDIRPYDAARDRDAVIRIWHEVGWIDSTDEEPVLAKFLDANNVEVGMIDGQAECSVNWAPGSIRYESTDVGLCAVTAVTTSRIARKYGFATTMTARAVRAGAEAGAAVAALGIFEQGFYDRVGFGSNAYDHNVSFDPRRLLVDHIAYRPPIRLTVDDHVEMFACLARRHRRHGAVVIGDDDCGPALLNAELGFRSKPFGLGYRDAADGRLTHFIFGRTNAAHGPYSVEFIAYETPHQLLELLRLLAELSDQVTTVSMIEPAEIQLLDLMEGPVDQMRRTRGGTHEAGISARGWMQYRMTDLDACVAARSWPGVAVECNVTLTDPVTAILARDDSARGGDSSRWSGVGGDYHLTIGTSSKIGPDHRPGWPTLTASVNAFTRLWFGARPASSIAVTDDLDGPPELLAKLDEALALPPPVPGWDF